MKANKREGCALGLVVTIVKRSEFNEAIMTPLHQIQFNSTLVLRYMLKWEVICKTLISIDLARFLATPQTTFILTLKQEGIQNKIIRLWRSGFGYNTEERNQKQSD